MTTIGDRIRARRKHLDLTQEELGKRVGVTKATINKYETGIVVNLRRPMIEQLAAALDTSPAYLMGWEENNVTVGTVGANNGVIGQNSGEIHIENAPSLTKEEQELIRIYNSLDVRRRMEFLSFAFNLEESND